MITLILFWSLGPSLSYSCDVEPAAKSAYGNLVGNAGCFVQEGNRLLVVENRLIGGRLTPPGGTAEAGESAQCTAFRETYEESGARVVVKGLLHRFENNFFLFRCSLKDRTLAKLKEMPVPPEFKGEISRAYWLDLSQSKPEQWRFPDQFPLIRDLLKAGLKAKH